jgi:hypothetical protein
VFSRFPPIGIVGIMGSTGVGTFEARSMGCVLMGPVTGLCFGMLNNSLQPSSFKSQQTLGRKKAAQA